MGKECMYSFDDHLFCDLDIRHGGPHHWDGMWWERKTDPPNWSPPRFTVAVELSDDTDEVRSTVVIAPHDHTDLDLTPHFGIRLKFRVIQVG